MTEHGEAIAYDCIGHGLRIRDLGRPWFSWTDLRAIVNRAYSDWTMELHRKLNPDWRFSDPTAYLLAEIATIESSRRYFELAARMGDEVPQEYWMARYGPKASVEAPPEPMDRTKAIDAAADLRAGLFA